MHLCVCVCLKLFPAITFEVVEESKVRVHKMIHEMIKYGQDQIHLTVYLCL